MSQVETQRIELSFAQPSITKTPDIETAVNAERAYRIVLQKDEDGRFVATCPDLPGVVTDGADELEAMENARYAVSDMLDSLGEPNKEFNLSILISA